MNQYLLLRRLRGPVILITFGVTALLDQYNVISYDRSWPLYLIVIGILQLAERAALARMPAPPPGGFYPPVSGAPSTASSVSQGSAITPTAPAIYPEDRSR